MRTRLEGVDMLVVLRGTLTGPLARLAVSSWLQFKRLSILVHKTHSHRPESDIFLSEFWIKKKYFVVE